MFKKKLLIISILALLLLPTFAYAINVPGWPIVPCGLLQDRPETPNINEAKSCGRCDLFKLLKNIIDFTIGGIMPPLAVLLFVWAGFLILVGGANINWYNQGREIFKNTFFGIIIILSAWLITNTLILSVGAKYNGAQNWWQYTCTDAPPTGPPPVTPTQKYSCNQNNQCVADVNGTYTTSNCDNKCQPVAPDVPSITTASLSGGTVGQAYSQIVQATGGKTPYNWSVTGSLPAGLMINSATGEIFGTPTTTGTSNFTVRVGDSSTPQQFATKQLNITVGGTTTTTPSITTSSLSDARQNSGYSQIVQATGGKTPYNWSVTGSLPAGLMINGSTGEIFGKPTVSGNFTFFVKVEDSSSPQKSATQQFSIKVAAMATSVVISNVASSNVTNTSAVITWTTDQPSTSQVVYGTTTAYGSSTPVNNNQVTSHSVTITTGLNPGTTYNYQAVSSITGFTARSSNYTFKTTGTSIGAVNITTTALSDATQNQSYSQSLSATGGTTPYSWSVSGGNLPAGLNLSSSGTISGTPTTTGTSTFTVRVGDSSTPQQFATKQLSLAVVGTNTLSIITSSLADGVLNQDYNQSLIGAGTGSVPGLAWSITSGSLPPSLKLEGVVDNTGQPTNKAIISGQPTAIGSFSFTVQIKDSSLIPRTATKPFTIKINPAGGTACVFSGFNLCQANNRTPYSSQTMVCSASACNQYVSAINQYAGRTGMANGANFLKAIMIKESTCNAQADSGHAQGLMQLKPSTANIYKSRCGVTADITGQWLKNNPELSICIAAEYMRALTQTSCGSTPRSVAAGYNGGSGACEQSRDCAGETSCAGGPVRRWECLYDNPQHTVCNDTRPVNYDETRDYAIKVLYCYNNPGF